MRPFYNFSRVASNEVVPVLLGLLTKQDEDATDDEYNISRAAYQCLQLYAQAVGATVIPPVIQFVEANLRSEDWHNRDAAVSAFGAIMDGPEEKVLEPIVKSGMQPLISMMDDPSVQVRDSTAYALGRITEACSEAVDPAQHLEPLLRSLFTGLLNSPKMGASCCWALMNLAERFAGEFGAPQNPITPHFNEAVSNLLTVTARPDCETAVRTAAYEVLNVFVQSAATESLAAIASLSDVIIKRLEETIPMQTQVVSVEDKITLEDIQTSLCAVLQAIIQRLDKEIRPQGDRIMQVLLQILTTVGGKSLVPEAVFATISSLANTMEEEFIKYMEAFSPFLYNALGNQEEPSLCSMAIGLVSDITRSMGERSQPLCDNFMNYLLNNLRVCLSFSFLSLGTPRVSLQPRIALSSNTSYLEHYPFQPVQACHSPMLWRYCRRHLWPFRDVSFGRCSGTPASSDCYRHTRGLIRDVRLRRIPPRRHYGCMGWYYWRYEGQFQE
jgi:importin subunit beta-1